MSKVISFEEKKKANDLRHCRDLCEKSLTEFVKSQYANKIISSSELDFLAYVYSYAFSSGYFSKKGEENK